MSRHPLHSASVGRHFVHARNVERRLGDPLAAARGVLVASLALAAPASAQCALLCNTTPPELGTELRLEFAAPDRAGALYALGCALSETPGLWFGELLVPLAPDALLGASLGDPATFQHFVGALDAAGEGVAHVALPADPTLAGLVVHAALCTLDLASPTLVTQVSAAIRMRLRDAPLAPDFSAVDTALQQALASHGIGGLSLSVIQDGQVLYEKAFGDYGVDDLVLVASASKWISGITLLHLSDEGLLELSDTVGQHVPNAPLDKAPITLRELVSHTSGLPSNLPCLLAPFQTLESCAGKILAAPLESTPGTVFDYGGCSLQLAGYIATQLTGESWEQVFQTRVAQPLGLAQTTYGGGTNPQVAGSLRSTLGEYARVLDMLLHAGVRRGVRVLSRASVARLSCSQTDGIPIVGGPLAQLGIDSYAVGNWRNEVDTNGSARETSSPGAFGAVPWIDHGRGYAGVLLMSETTAQGLAVFETIEPLIRAALDG